MTMRRTPNPTRGRATSWRRSTTSGWPSWAFSCVPTAISPICSGRELEQSVGIPLIWFDVLIHIGGAEGGQLTMSKLSNEIALTTGGVTRLVDRMVEAGLVARQNCPSDRRSVHVVLTPNGQATLRSAIGAHIEGIDRHLVAPLNESDRTALKVALSKLLRRSC